MASAELAKQALLHADNNTQESRDILELYIARVINVLDQIPNLNIDHVFQLAQTLRNASVPVIIPKKPYKKRKARKSLKSK